MDKSRSIFRSYRIFSAALLMAIFITGSISSMHSLLVTNSDLFELVQDGKNDIEEDRMNFGDLEKEDKKILIFDDKYLLVKVGSEFHEGVLQLTAHSLLVITPPPEYFKSDGFVLYDTTDIEGILI